MPSSTGMNASAPLPTPSIEPTLAPGKRGPAGMGPRTNYSRVNTGLPTVPDAGASEQKSAPPRGAEMLPKLAHGEESMGSLAGRASLSSMVKTAVAKTAERVRVTTEAQLQSVKTAGEKKEVREVRQGEVRMRRQDGLRVLASSTMKLSPSSPLLSTTGRICSAKKLLAWAARTTSPSRR